MLGWFSEARTWASRLKRASRPSSSANCSGKTFRATSRFSLRVSGAIHFAHAARAEWRDDLVRA